MSDAPADDGHLADLHRLLDSARYDPLFTDTDTPPERLRELADELAERTADALPPGGDRAGFLRHLREGLTGRAASTAADC